MEDSPRDNPIGSPPASPRDLVSTSELAEVAKRAALAGGEQLLYWRGKFETREKGPRDFVTNADVAAQEAVRELLLAAQPDHQFVGEETAGEGDALTVDRVDHNRIAWIVDPLDGTTNYLHGYPAFATSVAAVLKGQVLAGAIFDPVADELFWAAAGQGAWLGQTRLATGSAKRLADALVAISLPASVHAESPDLIDFFRIAPRCQAVRRMGSAALNLAYVACGRLDAYRARQIHAWDIAAGVLLVSEAGGTMTDDRGRPLDVWRSGCLATCGPELQVELLSELNGKK